jgi:murein L,D-transpeptidase YcbB/YkuD
VKKATPPAQFHGRRRRDGPVLAFLSAMTTPSRFAALLLAACSIAACSGDNDSRPKSDAPWAPAKLTSVRKVPAAEIEAALKKKLDGPAPGRISDDQWGHTRRLYRAYANNPLWLSSNGLHHDRAFALANAVLHAEQDGMRMELYPIGDLAQAMAVDQSKAPTADQLAQADIVLTASFAALAEDYLTGQIDPKTVAQSWHIDPQEENVDSALSRGLRTSAIDKAIASMRPEDPNYVALGNQLGRFKEIVAKGGWPVVPAGKPVKPGESIDSLRSSALRQRLELEGFTVSAAEPAQDTSGRPTPRSRATVYDRGLAGAVAQFQERHGIVVDSMLGEETLASLNRTAAYRTAQIAANLERMRWLPRTLGARYIHVNVPAFRLEAFDQGRKALEMKVIVGEEYEDKATPVFSDVMETVVFRPYWNVTDDIAKKEIFPKMSSGYLAANDYELYREGGRTRVRQKPGEKNSLGLVKFLFPNDFAIYLHDTPNRELFEKDVRAFSHGCIRVEKPAELAQWVLGWDAARVDSAMHGSDNQSVKAPQKIPVFITYGTAYIRDGGLYFANDLYERDDQLVAEVMRGALPSAETVNAVQSLRRIAART